MNRTIVLTDDEKHTYKDYILDHFELNENSVICGDFNKINNQIPDKYVDLILLDPPYNITKTYGENTSVVGMTRVASVKVIGLAAIFAIVIGFLGKFTALVSTIPNAVLGGVSLLLYGFIAVNGLKVLIKNQVNFEESKNVIVASSMLVLGLGGAAVSIVSGDLSLTISGMSLAAIIGILLNSLLKGEKEIKKESTLIAKEVTFIKPDMNKLKKDIKEELTVELKEDILKAIHEEMNHTKKKK